jgi:hypothetical protein
VDEEWERGVLEAMSDGKPPKFPDWEELQRGRRFFYKSMAMPYIKWRVDYKLFVPLKFDELLDRIDWMLSHRELANKQWFLEQLESYYTFIQQKEKEVLDAL